MLAHVMIDTDCAKSQHLIRNTSCRFRLNVNNIIIRPQVEAHILKAAPLTRNCFGFQCFGRLSLVPTQRRNQIQVLMSQNATVAEYSITSRLERSLFSSSSSCSRRFSFTIWMSTQTLSLVFLHITLQSFWL